MEWALQPCSPHGSGVRTDVSILVLMEWALQLTVKTCPPWLLSSFNPCLNGMGTSTYVATIVTDDDELMAELIVAIWAIDKQFKSKINGEIKWA